MGMTWSPRNVAEFVIQAARDKGFEDYEIIAIQPVEGDWYIILTAVKIGTGNREQLEARVTSNTDHPSHLTWM
jgi:hypothetical protein